MAGTGPASKIGPAKTSLKLYLAQEGVRKSQAVAATQARPWPASRQSGSRGARSAGGWQVQGENAVRTRPGKEWTAATSATRANDAADSQPTSLVYELSQPIGRHAELTEPNPATPEHTQQLAAPCTADNSRPLQSTNFPGGGRSEVAGLDGRSRQRDGRHPRSRTGGRRAACPASPNEAGNADSRWFGR